MADLQGSSTAPISTDLPGPSTAPSSPNLSGPSSAPSSPDLPGPSSAPSSPDLPRTLSAPSSPDLPGPSSAPSSPDLPGPSSAPSSPDLPGPSSAPSSLSKVAENFCRLCQLIMTVCSDLFRDILSRHIQPRNLRGQLDQNKNTLLKILKVPEHKELLYPPSGGQSLSAKHMDLSLLYTLLRNICPIPSHQAGWGKHPNPRDNSLAACIERIREQKNAIASHSKVGEVDDTNFQDIWNSLQTDIVNIEMNLIGGDMYERTVSWLFSCELCPPKAQKHIEDFKRLFDIMEEVQSQTRNKVEEAHSQTRQFHTWKKARITNIAKRQSAIKRKLIGATASKKARIGRLEKQHSLATSNIKEKLKETEQHILYMMQGKLSGIEEQLKETLKETVKNNFSMMQEMLKKTEKNNFSMMQDMLEDNTEHNLNKVQEKLKGTEEHILNTVQEMLTDNKQEILNTVEDMKSRHFPLVQTSIIDLPNMYDIYHISLVTSDVLWVRDLFSLKQVDATGNVIKTLDDRYKYYSDYGAHAVSKDGDLVFIARCPDSEPSTTSGSRHGVYKMTSDGIITTLFTTDTCKTPTCLYCSHINGDILIGMSDDPYILGVKSLVLRCDNTGRKIQDIELNYAGERLYRRPIYITENRINGDVVVSDDWKEALVVVDRSGRHRFDYTGRDTEQGFRPGAVCTDLLGRILLVHRCVDDRYEYACCISLLDQDGHFLTRLLTDKYAEIRSLCVDNNHNIYVGYESKIKVFK